jgi:hypothetical protein
VLEALIIQIEATNESFTYLIYYINCVVYAFVRLSRSRFRVSGSRRTDGQTDRRTRPLYYSRPFPHRRTDGEDLFVVHVFFRGLPKVNTRIFFVCFFFFALFWRVRCVWQNRPLCIFKWRCPRLIPGVFFFFPALFRQAAQGLIPGFFIIIN